MALEAPNGSPNKRALCRQLMLAPIFLFSLANCQQQQQQQNATTSSIQRQLTAILANQQQPQDMIESKIYNEETSNSNKLSDTLSSSMLKTYIRINNMRAYHLDLHSYRKDAKFAGDPSFADSQNLQHLMRCSKNLNTFNQLLKSFNEYDPVLAKNSLDSLRLADSYGRPEAGILSGNQFWIGSYDGCLDFEHKLENSDLSNTVKGQYCLGIAQFPNWNPRDGKTSIKIGLCLPETCTSSMLNDNQELLGTVESMMKTHIGENQPFNRLKLREVYCLPHKTSEIRQYSTSAICFLVVIGCFVLTSLVATTIDYLNEKLPVSGLAAIDNLPSQESKRTWRIIVIESFSIRRNFNKFIQIRADEPRSQAQQQSTSPAPASYEEDSSTEEQFDRTTFLNSTTGLKCVGLFWIVSAHVFLVAPITSNNLINLDKLTKTYLADIYLTAHLMVDTFFALSGLLASYFIFKNGIEKVKISQWIVATFHRYWRLTPIYLLCYWFTKSVGMLMSSGPMWDYMTAEQSPRLNCARESWWGAILHLSDFKSPKEHCVPFAWFIANGIKFWMVTPFLLVLIHKSMRKGYMFTSSIILANIALVISLAKSSNVDMKSLVEFRPESADNMLNNMGEIYTRPYSRIGAYLIGLLAGHLMYLIDTKQMEIKLSKNAKIMIWTIFSITVVALTFVLKIVSGIPLDEAALPWIFSISSGLIRPLWALCTCWLVFALAHGQARWLSQFLSASIWRLVVKLSFCAYLAQGEVIAQFYLARGSANPFTYVEMIVGPIVIITLTLVVSFVMVLLLEYPLTGIEELLLPRHRKTSKSSEAKELATETQSNHHQKQNEKLKCV